MSIIIQLDKLIIKNNLRKNFLASQVGISPANLLKISQNKSRLIRFSTLESLCRVLECQPGDLLEYEKISKKMMTSRTIKK